VSLTAKDVAEIMQLLEASHFDRLALEIDGLKLNLERGAAAPPPASAPTPQAPPPVAKAAPPEPEPAPAPAAAAVVEGDVVPSPLLGIFYHAPKPGEPPFVEVGSVVEADSVIGIVEVMKLMNSVRAGIAGEVVEILAENGALVEHGQPLLRVKPRR
jgi:acetyl-CoA carboxylase biotin carboxyl carrier protein